MMEECKEEAVAETMSSPHLIRQDNGQIELPAFHWFFDYAESGSSPHLINLFSALHHQFVFITLVSGKVHVPVLREIDH